MGSVMRLDLAVKRDFLIVITAAFGWLLLSIIIGAAGPQVNDSEVYYAYECPNFEHVWNSDCVGIQLNQNQTWQKTISENFSLLNRYWLLRIELFNLFAETQAIRQKLDIKVTILGKTNPSSDVWYIIADNDTKAVNIECAQGVEKCQPFVFIFEEFIRYPIYQIRLNLPQASQSNWVGDAKFEVIYGHDGYSRLEISFRVIYLIANIAVLAFFLRHMKRLPFSEWSWEQRSISLLLIGLICFNNIFDTFKYTSKGWFFPFMSSLMEVTFGCILLLFWLLMADKIRKDELQVEFNYTHIPKLAIVALYGIFNLIIYAWVSIRDETDPVFGSSTPGFVVLYYLASILWVGVIIWVTVLSVLSFPVVSQKPYLYKRFIIFIVPTAFVVLSQLVGILAGTNGPVGRSSLAFMYFLTLMNCYIYSLVYMYWPLGDAARNIVSEDTPLYYNFGSQPTRS